MHDAIRELESLALTARPSKRIDEIVQTLSNVIADVITNMKISDNN